MSTVFRWARVALWGSVGLVTTHSAIGCGSAESVSDTTTPMCAKIDPNGGGDIDAPPDGASLCPAGPCNYQTQTGCDSGQTCRPQFTAASPDVTPGCEAAGTRTRGEVCTTSTECAAGHLCAEGVCRKMCCGLDWSACDEGESCFRQLQVRAGGVAKYSGVDLCYPVGTCDVLNPTACDETPGQDCKLVDPRGSQACISKRPGKLGEECGGANLCERGLQCVGTLVKVCVRLCRALECGEPSCPPAEGTCVHFDRDPAGVGECTPNWVVGAGE